jgi:hypothetical protein
MQVDVVEAANHNCFCFHARSAAKNSNAASPAK